MTSINSKLGLKPAGRRSMMKLPTDRVKAARLTAEKCPSCGNHGASLSRLRAGWFRCTWCQHAWNPEDQL